MTRRVVATSFVCGIAALLLDFQSAASNHFVPTYTVLDLGTLGGEQSDARAINDSGVVVGGADLPTGYVHAFRYSGALPIQDLGTFGGNTSGASDVNSTGIIVGSAGPVTGAGRLAVWNGGVPYTPAPFTTTTGVPSAINDIDTIAGHIVPPLSRAQAMMYQLGAAAFTNIGALLASSFGGTMSIAHDLNESKIAVGYMLINFVLPTRAFRFTPPGQVELLPTLTGIYDDIAHAINDSGDIVGDCGVLIQAGLGYQHACLWSAGTVTDLGTLGGLGSSARSINNKGEIVGHTNTAAGSAHAYLRTGGQMLDLNGLIGSDPAWELIVANDINEHSQIVGWGYHNGLPHAFRLTPTLMPGVDVVATPVDTSSSGTPVSLTFDQIIQGGVTTLTTSASGPTPPAGFSLGAPAKYFEVSTTAAYTGSIEVCIDATGIDFESTTPELFHYESGAWVQVPSTFDSGTNTVCGAVGSLSPFALMRANPPSNNPPTVNAGGPYTVDEGRSVTLNASGSDPEDPVLTFAWDLDADGTFETPGQSVAFSAAAIDGPATRVAAVQATDPGGLTSSAMVPITVLNAPPVLGEIALAPKPVPIGAAVQASAPFTDAAPADRHTAGWVWGDGVVTPAASVVGIASAGHTYAAVGEYTLELTVTDDNGGAATKRASALVVYRVCPLYDTQRAVRSGSALPIRLQLCDAGGANLSSPALVLQATGVSLTSQTAVGPLDDTGHSSPDVNFRYDAGLAPGGGYIFNLSTAGLSTGTYALHFRVGAANYEYITNFQVR